MMKLHDQNKGFIPAYRPITRGSQGWTSLESGTETEAIVECCLVLMACSVHFLMRPRTACLEAALPEVGWAILYQLAIKTTPYRLAYG